MLFIKSEEKEFAVEMTAGSGFEGTLNDDAFDGDLVQLDERRYHLIKNQRSFEIEVVELNRAEKQVSLKVNGKIYHLEVKSKMDKLLEKMGFSSLGAGKVSEIKAPMPGMVLEIMVEPGQQVNKGDAVAVLEAMKMENILKSPADGVVKSIKAKQGEAVEKNEVLLNFE